nr:uncharacterized mitochondrial protein AtMg00810-like [Tanacetum cinerariifolium]
MFGQFMKMNTASSSGSRTLPGITTRSGTAYQGPTVPTTSSSLPLVVERETEVTKDTVPPTNNESTKYVQPPVVQTETPIQNSKPVVAPIIDPIAALVSASKPNQKPSIPYLSRLHDQKLHDKANDQREKFFQIFKDLNFNISFADALILMPKFGPTIKNLLTNKDKLSELARTPLNEHCSTIILKKLPEKLGDPGKFLIPCDFPRMAECLALTDLGASVNLMPLSVWNKLSLPELSPKWMTLELADRLISRSVGVSKDVFVKTRRALIDVFEGELTLRFGKEAITFHLDQTSRYSANYNDMTANLIDVIDMDYEEYSQEVLGLSNMIASGNPTPYYDPIVSTSSMTLTPFGDSDFLLEEVDAFLALEDDPALPEVDHSYVDTEGDIILLKAFLNDDPSLPPQNQGNYLPQVQKELKIFEAKSDKYSFDEPSEVELKDLPPHLECAFLEGNDKLPVIIAKDLSVEEKTALITILKPYKRAIAWKLSDIKGIDLEFCTHKILMADDFEPVVQHHRRVNPKILNVIKKEVLKLLDAGLMYPISDSPWKSHFMVKEGIVLGHKISKDGIEVNKARVEVIAKLPHPTTVKGIHSFLGHASFYRRFIKDFSKIARLMTRLIEKDTAFFFSIELMFDASDFAIGGVLGHTVQQIETTIPVATPDPASLKSNCNGKRRNMKAYFVCKSVDHLIKDYDFHTKKMAQPTQRNYAHKGHHKQYAPLTHSKPQKHMVPTIVLTQSKPVSNTAVRPVSAALPNISVTRPRHAHHVVTKFKSPIRRHITRSPSSKTSNSPPRDTAVQTPVVSAAQGKQGTWVWRPKCLILDHDFRTTSASMTLKWFDYNDALGRSKSGTCPIYLNLRSLKEDMLPLEVTQWCTAGMFNAAKSRKDYQELARRNELKAHGTLLMALTDKHQLKFNSHKDAKTLMEAIEKRFGGNTKTKKVQKTLLKQQFDNFTGSSSENLDQIHDRLQKLVSQLEIHGVSLFQEDVNLKFLRSLPSEWKTYTLIWGNKANLEEHSLDDLFNISTATSVSAVCAKLHVSSHLNINSLSNVVVFSFFSSQSTSPQLDNKDLKQIDVDDLEEIDLRWQMAMLTMKARRSYDWSYQAEEEHANFALMAITSSSSSSDNEPVEAPILAATPKPTSPKASRSSKRKNRKTCFVCRGVDHLIKDCNFHAKPKTQPTPRNYAHRGYNKQKASFTQKHPQKQIVLAVVLTKSKPLSVTTIRPVSAVVPNIMMNIPKHAHLIDTKSKSTFRRHLTHSQSPKISNSLPKVTAAKASVVKWIKNEAKAGSYNWSYQAEERPANYAIMAFSSSSSSSDNERVMKLALSSLYDRFQPSDGLVSVVVPKIKVTRPSHAKPIVTKPNSPIRQHLTCSPSPKGRNSPSKGTAIKAPVGNPQHALKDKGVIDSGCSWHMTGNMSYLSYFKELNGGYVAFGGNPKGVLLKVPRENNMYNVNLKNIVPSGDLTCLFAKATIDESNLWHRSTNTFSDAGPSNATASSIYGKSSFMDASQLPNDPDMLELEDITQSTDEDDVGAEADFNNLETSITSAFLYGTIEEEVYVCQPPGFEDPDHPDKAYKVVKTLYDLHQALKAWQKDDILLVQIYVDDIIFGATNKDLCKSFEKLMKEKFQMSSMGELAFFLGLQVKQKKDGIFISQDKYVTEILRKFGLTEQKSASTPIDTEKPLLKDLNGEDVDVHTYISMIGSLMYLTSSRLDIMFVVCACAHFQVTPKALHLHVVKKIFRYLKGKPHLGLWYPKDSPFDLVAYSDSDYAGTSLDRKSTTEGCQFFRCRLISWQCKKQTVVATSSTKAEYIAAASCCTQVLWIQNQL